MKLFRDYKDICGFFLQKIITSFVIIFCFIFCPVFFFYTAIDTYFISNIDDLKNAKLAEMDNSIDYLNKYSNNKKYFHYLLSKISDYAQKSNNPIEYLKSSLDNLRKRYPKQFQFLVWDEKGRLIKEISDESNYDYVLNKIYESLYEVTNAVISNPNIKISKLSSVKKNIKILQTFFGRLFIAENLKKPISDDLNSGPLMTEIGYDYSYAWFSIKEKVSFLCFISSKLINDYDGLNKISSIMNNNSDIIYGFSVSPDYVKPVSKFPARFESNLILALASFENGGDNVFENDKSLVKMSMPQPNVRTFCFLPKTGERWEYRDKKNFSVGVFISLLLIIYSFLGFRYFYQRHFFSISWKLTLLFLFANIVPIVILGFIINKHIENKKTSLKNEIIEDLERKMRKFDLQYNNYFDKTSSRICYALNVISERIGSESLKEKEIKKIETLFDEFSPSALYIVASSGEIISYKQNTNNVNYSLDFVSVFGKTSLGFLNNKAIQLDLKEQDIFSSVFNIESSEFYRSFIKSIGKIRVFFLGNTKHLFFFYTFGQRDYFKNNYLLMLIWNNELFQKVYINDNFNDFCKSYSEASFCVNSNSDKAYCGHLGNNQKLNSILDKNFGNLDKISGNIEIEGKKYIYTCLKGKNLNNVTMMAIFPERLIDNNTYYHILYVILGAIISLMLTIIIGQLLTFQFLNPIHNIGEAANAIKDCIFTYRIPIGDKDEFGYLSQVFNRVIEGLEDFEVAKVVQESLLPGNHFSAGEFDIFARTVVMTTLGGDYYDCFKINDNYLGIIIGDVAGHGIPAGLMMAMAKSAVLSASEDVKLNPTFLTERLHKMFFSIKNERLKRMMTFQYFVLNVNDGHFVYTNAGHCFPIIFDNNTNKAIFLDYIATPLGIGPKCRCKNSEFDLKKGQSLVLYTDAIIEACNAENEQFGLDRFLKCLSHNYNSNPESFYSNLYYKVYKNWVANVNDDFSLILINRK